jgi:hypothetical protein
MHQAELKQGIFESDTTAGGAAPPANDRPQFPFGLGRSFLVPRIASSLTVSCLSCLSSLWLTSSAAAPFHRFTASLVGHAIVWFTEYAFETASHIEGSPQQKSDYSRCEWHARWYLSIRIYITLRTLSVFPHHTLNQHIHSCLFIFFSLAGLVHLCTFSSSHSFNSPVKQSSLLLYNFSIITIKMSFRSAILAAAFLATAANAHVTMLEPVIYSQDKALIDTAPLTPEQFPCHSQYGFDITKMNPIAVGAKMQVKLKGSAIHGGGSCQLSVTTDMVPTKDSKFKVIKSFEGDCPATGDATMDYELPASIPNGKATFAWTWNSVLSGGPELYMNCAPIEVSGGASDTTAFDALPDMLVANLGSATTCRSVTGFPVKFPNPGAVLQSAGALEAKLPTGDCGATGTTPPASSPSAPSTPSVSPVASVPSTPSMSPVASAPSAPGPEETELTCEPDETPAPSAAPIATPAPSSVVAPSPVATSTPVVAPPVASTAPLPVDPAPVTGGSSCSNNGALVCKSTTQFGLCNNGSIVWQAVAPGTTCVNGAIMKRSSAFKASYNGRIVRSRTPVAYKA